MDRQSSIFRCLPAWLEGLFVPIVASALVALACLSFLWVDLRNAKRQQQDAARIATEQVALGLQGTISEHLSVLAGQRDLAVAMHMDPGRHFEGLAEVALERLDGLVALRLVTPAGSVDQSLSRLGRIPLPETSAVERARHDALDGRIELVPVLVLGERARLLGAFIPYRKDNQGSSLLHAIIDPRAMIRPLLSTDIDRRYRLSMKIGDTLIHSTHPISTVPDDPRMAERTFSTLGADITIAAWPIADLPGSDARMGLIIFALVAPLLTFMITWRSGQAKRNTRQSEARFRDFADIAADWFWEFDENGICTYISPRHEELTGVASAYVHGRHFVTVLANFNVDAQTLERVATEVSTRQPCSLERSVAGKDGTRRRLSMFGRPSYNERGIYIGYRGIGQDTTLQYEYEQDLLHTAAVFDSTSEGIIIAGPDRRIESLNAAFQALTGYARAHAVGADVGTLLRIERQDGHSGNLWDHAENHGSWRGEVSIRTRDGSVVPSWICISIIKARCGTVSGYALVVLDMSEIREKQAELERVTHQDSLTGLPNRLMCEISLDQILRWSRRNRKKCAVLFVDIDNFNKINNSHGHSVGDEILCETARRIWARIREADVVARIGGDDFVIVLSEIDYTTAVARVVEDLLSIIADPIDIDGTRFVVHASIGISLCPDNGADVESLIRNADAAMFQVKEQGRGTYRFYTDEMTRTVTRALTIETGLREALENGELMLHFQPQFETDSDALSGLEALVRWQHPEHGMIPPGEFIPVAEKAGLIRTLDFHVLRSACEQLAKWDQAGLHIPRIAVNVTTQDLDHSEYSANLQSVLSETGLQPNRLELELTESQLIDDTCVRQVLDDLRALGVRVAVDDFGTGYSSLAYLRELPIDQIKLDRKFIHKIAHDSGARAICAGIISMADTLNIETLAEGIENADQLEAVRALGCGMVQGFHTGKPMPASDLDSILRRRSIHIAAIGPDRKGGH